MKKLLVGAIALAALSTATVAQASDRKVMLPIEAGMAANDAQGRLGDDVKFYFGTQKTPVVVKKLGAEQTNQKTNAFGKSDAKACNWAFLSAMLQLEKHAREVGANAVINIVSNYKNIEHSSETEFECHAGAVIAGVALKGDFVKVQK